MRSIFSVVKKGILYLKANGLTETYAKVRHYLKYTRINSLTENEAYKKWMQNCEKIDAAQIQKEMAQFDYHPLFSVCIPVYNVEEKWLRKCIASVENQYYEHWQLCLADDCSTDPRVRDILKEYERKDSRIRVVYRKENGHISRATNSALQIAEGEFIVLMDNDDELSPDALFEAAKLLQEHRDADVIYSDSDKLTESGERVDPYFKPDYCPDTLLSYNYISHLGIYRKTLVDQVGGFRTGVEGSQDYDLLLRVTELTDRVYHIPKILYHWRIIEGSTASGVGQKNYAYLAGKKVLEDAVRRRGYHARVKLLEKILCYNVEFYPVGEHLISIIIPTKDKADVLQRCLESIYKKTKTQNYEIIVVDNNSEEEATFQLFKKYEQKENFRVLKQPIPFNYSRLNNEAARIARGDLLLFLNNDVEVITEDWLTLMAGEAERKEIGAVGVKLLYPDDTVQHAGIMVGFRGTAGNIGYREDRNAKGYKNCYKVRTNYSAVTAACMMVKKKTIEEVEGFDERLAVDFNDVDFCLKIRERGYYNIFLPDVCLYHYESLSRGKDINIQDRERYECEKTYLQHKWGVYLKKDPCINRNFDRESINFKLQL